MKKYPAKFNVSDINGKNGFSFINDLGDIWFGQIISNLGDINGDGKSDFMVSSLFANRAYVLFGAESFPAEVYTSQLNGKNGFMIVGESDNGIGCGAAGIGDINGDGINDLSIADCSDTSLSAYVIFGAKGFPPRVSVANLRGPGGFKLVGDIETGFSGADGLGDINGDGLADFGFSLDNPNNKLAAFIIYGACNYPDVLDMSTLNGNNGFIITELNSNGGISIAGLGDFNGDGKADFSLGLGFSSQAVVIFGGVQFPPIFSILGLNGTTGFTIAGANLQQVMVSSIGDVNGDGLQDIGLGVAPASEAYLVFGGKEFVPTIYVDNLNGTNGVKLTGTTGSNFGIGLAGTSSIEHNGRSGVIVASPTPHLNRIGGAFVFFGSDNFPDEVSISTLDGANGFEIVGQESIGYLVMGVDNFIGQKPVLMVGAENKTYIIFPDEI